MNCIICYLAHIENCVEPQWVDAFGAHFIICNCMHMKIIYRDRFEEVKHLVK